MIVSGIYLWFGMYRRWFHFWQTLAVGDVQWIEFYVCRGSFNCDFYYTYMTQVAINFSTLLIVSNLFCLSHANFAIYYLCYMFSSFTWIIVWYFDLHGFDDQIVFCHMLVMVWSGNVTTLKYYVMLLLRQSISMYAPLCWPQDRLTHILLIVWSSNGFAKCPCGIHL